MASIATRADATLLILALTVPVPAVAAGGRPPSGSGKQAGSAVQADAGKPAPAGSQEPLGLRIARRGTATVDDACRVFAAMAAQHGRLPKHRPVERMSFGELVAALGHLSVISPRWSLRPDQCLRRDLLAYMAASYLGCRPGLLTSLFGMTRRYAHREMLYRGIIAPGPPKTLVSGSELLSVATRVARRLEQYREVTLTDDEIH